MANLTRDNLGYLLAKASQRWNELLYERFVAAGFADVRPAYGSILVPLFEEDGLRMGELARRARLSKQTMTTMVRLLERDGLVRRGPDPTDGRASLVFLTERSRAFRPVAECVLDELGALVEAVLGRPGAEALRQTLKGVIEIMNTRTATVVLRAPKEEVFAYLADIENLPDWATEFARELKVVDGRHVVVNGLGEFLFRIEADPETGVIDMLVGPSEDALGLFPTRVVALPGGGSAFTFTMFQQPGQPGEQFEGQHGSLVRELENLVRRFG